MSTYNALLLGSGLFASTLSVAPGSAPARLAAVANPAVTVLAGAPATIGSKESYVLVTLDCAPLLLGASTVAGVSATVSTGTGDVTGTMLQNTPALYGSVVALLIGKANAVPGAIYTIALGITLSTGEVLEQTLPPLYGVA